MRGGGEGRSGGGDGTGRTYDFVAVAELTGRSRRQPEARAVAAEGEGSTRPPAPDHTHAAPAAVVGGVVVTDARRLEVALAQRDALAPTAAPPAGRKQKLTNRRRW